MLTMFIDHIGVVLFPDIMPLRIVGRIAFPLIAYQIGISVTHTSSIKKYFMRLLFFGVIIQTAYVAAEMIFDLGNDIRYLNIFFTLSAGVAAVYAYRYHSPLLVLPVLLLSPFLRLLGINMDYGLYGIMLAILFDIFRTNLPSLIISTVGVNLLFLYIGEIDYIQLWSVLSLIFIVYPRPLSFSLSKYAFYLFYPLHLILIYGISMLFPA